MKTLKEIERSAMQLPDADREALAYRLLEGVTHELTDIDTVWLEEAKRRHQDLVSGKDPGMTFEEFKQRFRSRRDLANEGDNFQKTD